MFSFLGLRKDSKKSSSEKEVDGGFVIIGETLKEERRNMQTMNFTQLSTNVIVQPSKSSCMFPAQPTSTTRPAALPDGAPAAAAATAAAAAAAAAEAASPFPDLLSDVPFALAPHVQAMQGGLALMPDVLLLRDIHYNLASFQYDFTLENSVLHNA